MKKSDQTALVIAAGLLWFFWPKTTISSSIGFPTRDDLPPDADPDVYVADPMDADVLYALPPAAPPGPFFYYDPAPSVDYPDAGYYGEAPAGGAWL